jgi:tetratricopeptide (TPR) repeat protein
MVPMKTIDTHACSRAALLLRIAAAALLLAIGAAHAQSPPTPAVSSEEDASQGKLLAEGIALVQARRFAEAIDGDFDKVIGFYENRFRDSTQTVYCARSPAESLFYLLQAANSKKAAVVLKPTWADAYYLRAYSLIELGRAEDAKQSLNSAVALSPQNSQYLSELGDLYSRGKDWKTALALFQKAADAAGFSPPAQKTAELGRARRGIGYVYVEMNRLDEAEAIYSQCLELDPNDRKAQAELQYVRRLREKNGE